MTASAILTGWVLVPALLFVAILCVIVPGAVIVYVADKLDRLAADLEAGR